MSIARHPALVDALKRENEAVDLLVKANTEAISILAIDREYDRLSARAKLFVDMVLERRRGVEEAIEHTELVRHNLKTQIGPAGMP